MNDLPDNLTEVFEYLDELRESGETNMFGARPYVQQEFGLDGKVGGLALSAWMQTFDGVTAAADRAQKALSESPSK